MSTPYVGEIRIFGFPRIPTGWFACDGSLKSIAEYSTLFTLLGTSYGGDGVTTFAVPDLRGQVPVHQGQGAGLSSRTLGERGGSESVTLLTTTIPSHTHLLSATTSAATTITPGPTVIPGAVTGDTLYLNSVTPSLAVPMAPTSISMVGGSEPHDNTMPTLTLSICIAWAGIFPSRN